MRAITSLISIFLLASVAIVLHLKLFRKNKVLSKSKETSSEMA